MGPQEGELPDFTERRLDGEVVSDLGFISIERDRIRTHDGVEAERCVVRHVGAVAAAAITADGRIVLVHQYRYAPGMHTMEVPAGKLDKEGEDPLECARRELMEETGHESDDWSWMFDTLSSPGFTDEVLKVYLARDARKAAEPSPDSGESVCVVPLPLAEAYKMVLGGQLTEARTQLAVLWLKDRGIPDAAAFGEG